MPEPGPDKARSPQDEKHREAFLREAGIDPTGMTALEQETALLRHRMLQGLSAQQEKVRARSTAAMAQGRRERPFGAEMKGVPEEGLLAQHIINELERKKERVRTARPGALVPTPKREPGALTAPGTGIGPFGVLRPGEKNTVMELGGDILADVARVPVVQQIVDVFSQAASGTQAGILGGIEAVSGDPEAARERLAQAGRLFVGAIPGTENVPFAERVMFADISDRLGIPKGRTIDLGVLGSFRPRAIVDLGGEFVTDPFIVSRLRMGQLVGAGEKARLTGDLAKAALPGRTRMGFGPRDLSRVGSDVAEQMRQGQRALLSVHIPGKGRVALRVGGSQRFIDAPIAEIYDMARRGLAQSGVGRMFNVSPGPQFRAFTEEARGAAREMRLRREDDALQFWIEVEAAAKKADMPLEEAYRKILSSARAIPEGRASAAALKEQQTLYGRYRKDGFSVDEAIAASRAATLAGADPIMAPFGMRLQDHFASGLFDEVDAGVVLSRLTDPAQQYIARVLTEDGQAFLKKRGQEQAFRRFFREWYGKASFARKRKALWDGFVIPEVNDWMRTHVKGWDKTFFEENPARIASIRARKAEGPIRAAELHATGGRHFGRKATPEHLEAGWEYLSDIIEENKLQQFRKTGTGPAKEVIDVEHKRLIEAELETMDLDATVAESIRSMSFEDQQKFLGPANRELRNAAIDNLLKQGKIARTKLGRAETFGGLGPRDIVVPPEIAREMRHAQAKWANPKAPGEFMRFYDGQTQMFKAGNTVWWPGYHTRNNVHNFWMLHVADVHNPMRGVEANRAIRSVTFGDGTTSMPWGQPASGLVRQLEARGAFGFGQSSATELGGRDLITHRRAKWQRMFLPIEDVERVGLPRSGRPTPGISGAGFGVTGKARIPIAAAKLPFRVLGNVGRLIGEGSEDFAKLTLANDRIVKAWKARGKPDWSKGIPDDVIQIASEDVRKYLFDYSDISPAERTGAKRAVPFYTFARKNFPLMLETLVTKPDKIAELALLQRAAQGEDAIDMSFVPEFVSRGLFGLDVDQEGTARIYNGLGIGFEDLQAFDSNEHFIRDMLGRLNPAIKGIAQEVTNRDFFFGGELSEMAPSSFRHFPKSVTDWMDFKPVFRQGKLSHYRMNPTLRNFIQNAPVLSAASRFISTSERFERRTGEQDVPAARGSDPSEPLRTLTGFRFQTLSPQQKRLVQALNFARDFERFLEGEVAAGRADKFGPTFRIRRDVLSPNADDRQRAEFQRLAARTKRAIALWESQIRQARALSAAERARLTRAAGMRGGGR